MIQYLWYIYDTAMYAVYIEYICNHENNVPSRLSPQWLSGSSCTWAHMLIYMLITCINLFSNSVWIRCNVCSCFSACSIDCTDHKPR